MEKRIVGFENSKFGIRGICDAFDLDFLEFNNEKVIKKQYICFQTIFLNNILNRLFLEAKISHKLYRH
jgi:hypothetical protein